MDNIFRQKDNRHNLIPGSTPNFSNEFDFFIEAKRISKILLELPMSPCDTLKAHMKRKKITINVLVSKSGVSEATIRRLRNDPTYRPSKNNALAICIGLQLEPMLSKDWLNKIGIVMTASPTDILYSLFLNYLYNQSLSVINEILESNGFLPLSKGIDELDC